MKAIKGILKYMMLISMSILILASVPYIIYITTTNEIVRIVVTVLWLIFVLSVLLYDLFDR